MAVSASAAVANTMLPFHKTVEKKLRNIGPNETMKSSVKTDPGSPIL